MLNGKMGNFGAKKAKKHGFDWQQGYGGGALVKAPKEKWGKFPPISSHFPLIFPHFSPFPPIFSGTGYISGTLLGI